MTQVDIEMSAGSNDSSTESSDPDKSSSDQGEAAPTVGGCHSTARKTMRRGAVVPTAICLSKAAIGAGVLSMASHAGETGLTFMLTTMVIGGLLTVISICMIGEAALETRRWSFEDICEELFHPVVSFITGFINASSCLGSATAYLIIAGQVFQVLTGTSATWRRGFIIIVGLVVCLPLCLAKHVGFMRHLATLSILGLVFLIASVVYVLELNGPDPEVASGSIFMAPPANTYTYMNCLNIVVFAYNNQFNVPQLVGELNPQGPRQVTLVSIISTCVAFALYSSVCFFGIWVFGYHQPETLVLALTPYKRSLVVIGSLVSVLFSVLMCFEFHIYPIRQFLAYTLRKIRRKSAEEAESNEELLWGRPIGRTLDIICGVVTVLFAIATAVFLTSLRTLLDFMGAFAAAYISMVVPPLWLIRLQMRRNVSFRDWVTLTNLLNVVVLGLGVFFFIFGTYASLHGNAED